MTEEWLLSVADVAEVLGTSREHVASFIASERLTVIPGRRTRVAHSALVEFVAEMQRDALMLGRDPDFTPTLLASRPGAVVDNNHPEA